MTDNILISLFFSDLLAFWVALVVWRFYAWVVSCLSVFLFGLFVCFVSGSLFFRVLVFSLISSLSLSRSHSSLSLSNGPEKERKEAALERL